MRRIDSAEAAIAAAGLRPVSRETSDRLRTFIDLLGRWNRMHNLVGPSALADIWERHVADSAQLLAIAPHAVRWIDLGSGSGFPGMITAILLAGRADAAVHLVESNATKAAFLQEAARVTEAPAQVHRERIEFLIPAWDRPVDAISARAVAPMAVLAEWAAPLIAKGTPAYLHKGLDFTAEWGALAHPERFDLVQHRNRISSGVVAELRRKGAGKPSES